MSSLLTLIHLTANWQDVNYHRTQSEDKDMEKADRIMPMFSDEWIGPKCKI